MSEFDDTLGALCIGYIVATALFGVMSMQCFQYFQAFEHDTKYLKTLVAGLWFLDTMQLVFIGHTLYYWGITNFTNPSALKDTTWSLPIGKFITNLIVFIVQLFLAWRVFILSNKNWHIPALIAFLSLVYIGFVLTTVVESFQLVKVALFYKFQWMASTALACAATTDLIIACSLSYYLHRGRSGIVKTDSIINKLLLYAINSGLLTSILAISDMTCFIIMPKNLVHLAFNIVVGKLYTNSVLATLNFRQNLRCKGQCRELTLTGSLRIVPGPQNGGTSGGASILVLDLSGMGKETMLNSLPSDVHDVERCKLQCSHVAVSEALRGTDP